MVSWGPKIETGYKSVPQLYRITDDQAEQTNKAEQYPRLVKQFQHQIDILRESKP